MNKQQLVDMAEFLKYKDYSWKEITIGCSNTQVFEISKGGEVVFLKIGENGALTQEYESLKLLNGYLSIPKVVKYINDGEFEYLLTEKMPGEMSCDDIHLENEDQTLEVLVFAIKQIQNVKLDDNLKENLNVYKIEDELLTIKEKIDKKEITNLPNKTVFNKFTNLNEVYKYLVENKPTDQLVFSHGDVSMPNVFINNGKLAGFIDIGNVGIRQKWYDIADAYVSVRRNFESQEVADKFLAKLGINDKSAVEYYEMLIDLG